MEVHLLLGRIQKLKKKMFWSDNTSEPVKLVKTYHHNPSVEDEADQSPLDLEEGKAEWEKVNLYDKKRKRKHFKPSCIYSFCIQW